MPKQWKLGIIVTIRTTRWARKKSVIHSNIFVSTKTVWHPLRSTVRHFLLWRNVFFCQFSFQSTASHLKVAWTTNANIHCFWTRSMEEHEPRLHLHKSSVSSPLLNLWKGLLTAESAQAVTHTLYRKQSIQVHRKIGEHFQTKHKHVKLLVRITASMSVHSSFGYKLTDLNTKIVPLQH